jgi:dihydrolipoamide dehydrogenase
MAESFDVVVIGAGPGGYIAAIRCAQLGFKTACIDDWSRPMENPRRAAPARTSAAFHPRRCFQSSENYDHAAHAFAEHGIGISGLTIDVKRMLARKDKVVQQNNDGILYLFKKNKVTPLHGLASFAGRDGDGWTLKIDGPDAGEISAAHVIIATGSKPARSTRRAIR